MSATFAQHSNRYSGFKPRGRVWFSRSDRAGGRGDGLATRSAAAQR